MESIGIDEARRLVEQDGALLVDCRERYEWDELRIPGARLVPLSILQDDPAMIEELPLVVFHCAVGQRSQVAAALYESARPAARGFSMDGGIVTWAASGLPTESGAPA